MSAPDYNTALVKNVTAKHKPITCTDVPVSWDDSLEKSDNLTLRNTQCPRTQ